MNFDHALALACGILLINNVIVYSRQGFYRAYFRQKQIHMGKDPDKVIREEFPWLWRIM